VVGVGQRWRTAASRLHITYPRVIMLETDGLHCKGLWDSWLSLAALAGVDHISGVAMVHSLQ